MIEHRPICAHLREGGGSKNCSNKRSKMHFSSGSGGHFLDHHRGKAKQRKVLATLGIYRICRLHLTKSAQPSRKWLMMTYTLPQSPHSYNTAEAFKFVNRNFEGKVCVCHFSNALLTFQSPEAAAKVVQERLRVGKGHLTVEYADDFLRPRHYDRDGTSGR